MAEKDKEDAWERLYKAYGQTAAPAAAAREPRGFWQQAKDTALDVAESGVTGLARGVAGSPGAFADIARMGQAARDYMRSTNIGGPSQGSYDEVRAREDARRERGNLIPPSALQELGSQRFIERADDLLVGDDLQYRPETRAGRVVQGMGEIVGGAGAGGVTGGLRAGAGAMARNLPGVVVRQGAVPAVAVGGAQALGVENPVALGAIGLAAGGAAEMGRPRSAAASLQGRAGNATPQQLQQAEELFLAAQERGLPLSRANALDYVTQGATSASGAQRIAEGQNSPALREFYQGSPQRVATAGGQALDEIAPVPANPSTLGPRAAEAMQGELRDVNTDINAQTRPAYQQFEQTPVPGRDLVQLMQNPLFAREHARIFQSPEYAHLTQGIAPDSVQAIDITRRILAEGQQRASNPVSPAYDPTGSTGYGTAAHQAQDVASEASRGGLMTGQGQPSPLEAVQAQQAQLRQQLLEPLQQGPEGRVAASQTTEAAQNALFPQNPLEGTAPEIRRAIASIAQRDPALAGELVRNYLGSEFAQVQRGGQGGATYYAGPAYWKQVMGNPQQAANLTAALEALPNGGARAEAFHDVMRIFNAMGQRERPGSLTAPTQEEIARMKNSGLSEGAMKVITSVGTSWPAQVRDKFEAWRLGQNVDELASLFTDPARGADFARIVSSAPGSAQRAYQILRFLGTTPAAAAAAGSISAAERGEEKRERKAAGVPF